MTETSQTHHTDADYLRDFADMSSHGAVTVDGEPLDQDAARASSNSTVQGVDRQAGSAADLANRRWLASVLQELGARVVYDEAGNQYGLFEFVPDAPFVGVGSHLDSQPRAGRYDGAYGVLAAVHAAARVQQDVNAGRLQPTHNITVINWFNEEGSHFAPSMMGSGVFCGTLPLEDARKTQDLEGTTVGELFDSPEWRELVEPAPDGSATGAASSGVMPMDSVPPIVSYGEIHVEQGRLLEDNNKQIGLVTATWGASKFQVTVRGEQGHTGSTMMADRKDALFGASLIIPEVQRLTKQFGQSVGSGGGLDAPLQASVSQLTLEPNSPVTIAREVQFNIDLRSPDAGVLETAQQKVEELILRTEEESRCDIELTLTHHWELNPYSESGVALAREECDALGLSHQEILTVAGHDSTNMKELVPTVMLFIPSVEGISHNVKEYTTDDDCLAGVALLSRVVARLAQGALL